MRVTWPLGVPRPSNSSVAKESPQTNTLVLLQRTGEHRLQQSLRLGKWGASRTGLA